MAKCTRKLIDAEAAKAAIQYLADLQREFATHYEGRIKRLHEQCALCFDEAIAALDALPDASEGFFDYVAKEANRIGKSPQQVFAAEWEAHVKLKDDSLWPQPQQAGDGAEE